MPATGVQSSYRPVTWFDDPGFQTELNTQPNNSKLWLVQRGRQPCDERPCYQCSRAWSPYSVGHRETAGFSADTVVLYFREPMLINRIAIQEVYQPGVLEVFLLQWPAVPLDGIGNTRTLDYNSVNRTFDTVYNGSALTPDATPCGGWLSVNVPYGRQGMAWDVRRDFNQRRLQPNLARRVVGGVGIRLRRWSNDPSTGKPAERAQRPVGRPVLRVPLGSEAELPGARAAIRFAYTGKVAADSVHEALEVRRQASYLGIELCAAACVGLVRNLIDTPAAGAAEPPFLQLFKCGALWPDPAEEPAFAAVLASARQKLATHFTDAPLVLNTPALLCQLSELPAEALEGLLESDDFGTDSEDSVLLLLAVWMAVNHGRTDASIRERLCRRVRLVQVGRAYLDSVLPALAAAHNTALAVEGSGRPPSPAAWFPITVQELAIITALANNSADRNAWKAEAAGVYDMDSPWYLTRPRRQCIPAEGREYTWRIARTSLAAALAGLQPGQAIYLDVDEVGGQLGVFAHGFVWRPALYISCSDPHVALLVLRAAAPPIYMHGPVKLPGPGRLMGLVRIEAQLTVFHWPAIAGFYETLHLQSVSPIRLHASSVGCNLTHIKQPGEGEAVASSLAAWGLYLVEGWVVGSLRVLPMSPPGSLAAGYTLHS
ncbi:hypothetical protein GPECTOR_7g924 [Gonium pectorale]|uniref:BACK domain-containing protein n=1 Tax=Gonium pectorale TaxID=33097 RepID=A0A150GUK7_GONPE|nr:hypothetical protein GPECTOR_7g924 [Gonium pectorale]|eukprot:KXZ53474.1 hypothetical protein GPECTOR_7g924 [Gonium pectorale]